MQQDTVEVVFKSKKFGGRKVTINAVDFDETLHRRASDPEPAPITEKADKK